MTTPPPVTSSQLGNCRSCNASVRWAVMRESGKSIPLDLAPRPEGNVVFPEGFDAPAITVQQAAKAGISVDGLPVFATHFVLCPNAATHRKTR